MGEVGQSAELFYKYYYRHKIFMDISNKSESTTHQHCTQLFPAGLIGTKKKKKKNVLDLIGNLNLQQVPEVSS